MGVVAGGHVAGAAGGEGGGHVLPDKHERLARDRAFEGAIGIGVGFEQDALALLDVADLFFIERDFDPHGIHADHVAEKLAGFQQATLEIPGMLGEDGGVVGEHGAALFRAQREGIDAPLALRESGAQTGHIIFPLLLLGGHAEAQGALELGFRAAETLFVGVVILLPLAIGEPGEWLRGLHHVALFDQHFGDEAFHLGPHLLGFRELHGADAGDLQLDGYEAHDAEDAEGDGAEKREPAEASAAFPVCEGELHGFEKAEQRHRDPGDQGQRREPGGQTLESDGLEMRLHEDGEAVDDVVAVHPREHRVGVEEPEAFLRQWHARERLVVARAEEKFRELMLDERARFRLEVRYFDRVRHDVIAVETHQRIGVENDRRDRGDDHHVEEEILKRSRLHHGPEKGGERGDHEFHVDAGSGDEDAVDAVWHRPRIGHIHEEVGREDHGHRADFMDFAAVVFAGQSVAEFVDGLDEDGRHPHQGDVFEGEEIRHRRLDALDVEIEDEHRGETEADGDPQ